MNQETQNVVPGDLDPQELIELLYFGDSMIILKEKNIDFDEVKIVLQKTFADLKKNHRMQHNNTLMIAAAREVAKKFDIKYQDVLKLEKPETTVKGANIWDKNGYIKS